MNRILQIIFILTSINLTAQTDFPVLKQQFLDYRIADKQDSALFIARKMNQHAIKEQTDTSYWYALSLRYQGNVYETRENNDSTLFYWLNALNIFEKYHRFSDDHATSLNLLGIYNRKIGLYKTAEEHYLQSASIRRSKGVWTSKYAYSLNNLSWLYNSMGRYSEALSLVDSSLLILQKIYLNDSLKLIDELHSKAEILINISDYDGSEKLYFQCKSLCKKNNLPLEKYIKLEKDLAQLYVKKGKYAQAEVILLQVDSLLNFKEKNKEIYQLSAEIKFTLGKIKSITGQFNEAFSYYENALTIRRTNLPMNHPDIAESLASFGVLHAKLGEYDLAHNFYQEALGILKISLGETHPKYAENLNSIGSLNLELGDFKLAETQMLAALEIRKKALGEEHPGFALNLSSLGRLYRTKGDYSKAEGYYKRSLEIRLKIHKGEKHDIIASSLNLLGYVYFLMGRYSESETLLIDSYRMRKELEIAENPNYAMNLYNLGMLYYKLEKYNLSEEYLVQSIEIRKRLFGENNNELISSKLALSKLFLKTNRLEEAFSILEIIFNNKLENISSNFEWLSESQKELYWKKEEVFFDQLSCIANECYSISPRFSILSYNAALVSKSKLLEAKIAKENYYWEIEDIREKLWNSKRILAKIESEGIDDQVLFQKTEKEADSLDKLLTLSWPEYAQQKKNLSITWDQVQQNLENGEVAVEFVRFKNEDDSVVYYNALVLKKGDKNPTLVKLCREKDLQSITPNMGFSAYYPLIWQPLEGALKDVKTIYYAPTGELYNVPFHAIYVPKGKGDEILAAKTDKRGAVVENTRAAAEQNAEFLMDRYTLHQLTSTRYLALGLKQKANEPLGNSIAMVGGVNYDYLPGSTSTSKKNKKDKNANRSSESASGKLSYLEGTKTEVQQINQQVTTATWQTKLIENNDATEETITKLEGKEAKGILHIATHGFAFPEYDFNDTTVNKNSLRYSYRYSKNPMVRSGVILAGGNWALVGSDTLAKLGAEQNGILTALEVSQLNLKKTKLVVLSACETGLGKIEGSEGTFGLKRGFKLAGVEQMIVSLWSVPDKETMELMTLFYSDLTNTLNPVVSFSNAQKEMRNKYPSEPEKWAGFVLVR